MFNRKYILISEMNHWGEWGSVYVIPFQSHEKIKKQLENGNEFALSAGEWSVFPFSGKDIKKQLAKVHCRDGTVHVKVTNDVRRMIMKQW